jgi:hypothetical protein
MTNHAHLLIERRTKPKNRGQSDMKLRLTINNENSGGPLHCFQQLSRLFSEQAFDSSTLSASKLYRISHESNEP